MPSFRPAKEQARHAVTQKIAFGCARHSNKTDGKIHSLGTARCYSQPLSGFARFIQSNKLGDLKGATKAIATAYLIERQEAGLSQKSLDLDRQAIQCHIGQALERVHSFHTTALSTRSYTAAQIREITRYQSDRNGLATQIAYAAGLRAHELHTLKPASERSASGHREWSPQRFTGRENGVRYTVDGKGGLIREVQIPFELAARLEAARFADGPHHITDRGIHYVKLYDVGGGKNWSISFTRVSRTQLGWSNGAHGVRHSYAQERLDELLKAGFHYEDALGITAQELGHFSAKTTEAYLR